MCVCVWGGGDSVCVCVCGGGGGGGGGGGIVCVCVCALNKDLCATLSHEGYPADCCLQETLSYWTGDWSLAVHLYQHSSGCAGLVCPVHQCHKIHRTLFLTQH